MIRLVVWITLPDGRKIVCGEIICSGPDSRGRMEGAFRYTDDWLDHPQAFALDPHQLPLAANEYVCTDPTGIFPIFEDSLPDDWGRRLLIRKAELPRGRQGPIHLLQALGCTGLGALAYFPEAFDPAPDFQASAMDLEQLVDASLKYQAQKPLANEALHLLFAAASSPGGARPKALIRTAHSDQWLAKFPSANDTFQMVPIEAATLGLARAAGVTVPDFRIETCGNHQVLLIKRFDTTLHNGRRHMISFQTLLQAKGYYTVGYTDLFTALRKITTKPRTDLPALFRQMVFNALIGNTDDHLKNFCLLHDDKGYHLSPAYDLLPDTVDRREHVLHFDPDFICPGREQLIRIGKKERLPSPETTVDEIQTVVSGWEDEFIRWGVGKDDRDRLAPGIERRLSIR